MSNAYSRRRFLRTVIVTAGGASLAPLLSACGGREPDAVFPQSVAAGDPRADSIVLWTRVEATLDAEVRIELATDPDFSRRVALSPSVVTARADHDHCVRVKVGSLAPETTYFYRFVHEGTASRTGRFRTAPAADADVPVRFAMLSCQDYVGRYYNTLLPLLEAEQDDLAFVLHLGDYVYETTGDPGFMSSGEGRAVTFREPDAAIALGSGESSYFAARSVSNYRDLYRTYRSDPILQRVHERFAFVCLWDDHEFSDDSWQDTATYSDGARIETDRERRLHAEQAYFEFMPVARDDETEGALTVEPATLFPNTRLYRALRFGRHLSLTLADYRSFRPDHPTPEDAYPGAVILDEPQVRATLAQLAADGELERTPDEVFATGAFFRPYVDLEGAAFADHKAALRLLLTAGYTAAGVEPARAAQLAATYAAGPSDAAVLAATIERGRAGLPAEYRELTVDPSDPSLRRGISYASTGKSGLIGQLGARYLVVQTAYDLVQAYRTRVARDTAHDDVLGPAQQAFVARSVAESDATWSAIATSVCSTSLVLDLVAFADALPPELPAARYYLNVDQWDGFPERRRALMRDVYRPANAVLLAGDIHGAYATDFGADAEGNRVIELTTPAVSSGTFRELLLRTGSAVPAIRDSGLLTPVLDALDGFLTFASPPLKLAESDKNGITIVQASATECTAQFVLLPAARAGERFYERPTQLVFERRTVVIAKREGRNGPLTLG